LIAASKDRSAAIVNAAVDPQKTSELCTTTVDTFISILASEAANLALKILATGGIYLAGGVPLHMLPLLQGPAFMESFSRKGRFAELMKRIPVHVILSRAALVGAAAYGLRSFEEEP